MRLLPIVLVILLSPSVGLADGPTERDTRARELFEHGSAAFSDGRFREAAQAFERAFQLSGRPALLLNAGNAWDHLGESGHAAEALSQYLILTPDAEDRAAIEARIELLEAGLQDRPNPELYEESDEPGLFAGRTYTWIVAGSAVAFAAASMWLWSEANNEYDLLSATCGTDGACTDTQVSSVRWRATASRVTLGLSLASIAAAVALFFIEDEPLPEAHTVTLMPGMARLELRGTF